MLINTACEDHGVAKKRLRLDSQAYCFWGNKLASILSTSAFVASLSLSLTASLVFVTPFGGYLFTELAEVISSTFALSSAAPNLAEQQGLLSLETIPRLDIVCQATWKHGRLEVVRLRKKLYRWAKILKPSECVSTDHSSNLLADFRIKSDIIRLIFLMSFLICFPPIFRIGFSASGYLGCQLQGRSS